MDPVCVNRVCLNTISETVSLNSKATSSHEWNSSFPLLPAEASLP